MTVLDPMGPQLVQPCAGASVPVTPLMGLAAVPDIVPPNWLEILGLETPLIELMARGSAMYLGVLVLFRIMPRRAGGELARTDLVFILLIAEAAAHALGDYTSIADGLVVIATLMAWDYAINFLSYHVRFIERLVSAPPVQIVRNGELLRRNMRREYLTEEELMSFLRNEGIDDIAGVKSAHVESEGRISVISTTKKA